MSDQELTPLSPLLRSLVDAERANVVADPARAAAVLKATESVLALSAGVAAAGAVAAAAGAGAGAKASAAAASAAKTAVSITVGKAVGIAVVAFRGGDRGWRRGRSFARAARGRGSRAFAGGAYAAFGSDADPRAARHRPPRRSVGAASRACARVRRRSSACGEQHRSCQRGAAPSR